MPSLTDSSSKASWLQQYWDRVRDFQERMNPAHLLVTKDTIMRYKQAGENSSEYQKAVTACVHPQTGEVIPPLGRLAAFVPINIPICAGMLLAAPTLPNLIGWQWINQTYNAYFNYSQANKDSRKGTDTTEGLLGSMSGYEDILKGYSCASIVSVALAVGSSLWLKRSSMSATLKARLQMIVPYTAVASAGVANVGLMRMRELSDGIPVFMSAGDTQTTEPLGYSKVAARQALLQTAISRIVLPLPVLALPPPILAMCYRVPAIQASRCLKVLTEMTVLVAGLWVGLPCAVGIFPQTASLPLSDVEVELQDKAKAIIQMRGEGGGEFLDDQLVTFNKGV